MRAVPCIPGACAAGGCRSTGPGLRQGLRAGDPGPAFIFFFFFFSFLPFAQQEWRVTDTKEVSACVCLLIHVKCALPLAGAAKWATPAALRHLSFSADPLAATRRLRTARLFDRWRLARSRVIRSSVLCPSDGKAAPNCDDHGCTATVRGGRAGGRGFHCRTATIAVLHSAAAAAARSQRFRRRECQQLNAGSDSQSNHSDCLTPTPVFVLSLCNQSLLSLPNCLFTGAHQPCAAPPHCSTPSRRRPPPHRPRSARWLISTSSLSCSETNMQQMKLGNERAHNNSRQPDGMDQRARCEHPDRCGAGLCV